MKRTVLFLFGVIALVLANASTSTAAFFEFGRYLSVSKPLYPESNEECAEMEQEFAEISRRVNDAHTECLNTESGGASPNAIGADRQGICSKIRCQSLHTEMSDTSEARSVAIGQCRQEVAEFIREKQAEEQRRATQRADAQRRAREEEARTIAQRQAREREKQAKEEAERREKAERELKRGETKQRRVAERQARERKRQEQEAKAQANQRSKKWELTKKTYEMRDQVAEAIEFVKDPAGAVEKKVLGELQEGVRANNGDSKNSDYQFIHDRAAELNSLAARENPFAKAISGAALDEIGRQNNATLGRLDETAQGINDFKVETEYGSSSNPFVGGRPDPATQSVYSDAAEPPAPSVGGATGAVVPSTSASTPETQPVAAGGASSTSPVAIADVELAAPASGASSPSSAPAGQTTVTPQTYLDPETGTHTYLDPETGKDFTIRAGHVLYRDPATRTLQVISVAALGSIPPSSDQAEKGEAGCGTSGLGVVTPECEAIRRAASNPFAVRPE